MSTKQLSWALTRKGITPVERVVLMILANRSDTSGWSFLSQATMAKQAECSRRNVLESLRKLEAKGFIIRLQRFNAKGGRTSDHIQIQDQKRCADFSQPPVQDLHTIPSSPYGVGREEKADARHGVALGLRLVHSSEVA